MCEIDCFQQSVGSQRCWGHEDNSLGAHNLQPALSHCLFLSFHPLLFLAFSNFCWTHHSSWLKIWKVYECIITLAFPAASKVFPKKPTRISLLFKQIKFEKRRLAKNNRGTIFPWKHLCPILPVEAILWSFLTEGQQPIMSSKITLCGICGKQLPTYWGCFQVNTINKKMQKLFNWLSFNFWMYLVW